jgi:hypothetical protein
MSTILAVYVICGVLWGFTGSTADKQLGRSPSALRFVTGIISWPLGVHVLLAHMRAAREQHIMYMRAVKLGRIKEEKK